MRSWYNAHVNNPYPTDEEKHVIMQETGLTIEQVSNFRYSVGQVLDTYHDHRSPTGLSTADEGTGLRLQDKLRPSRTCEGLMGLPLRDRRRSRPRVVEKGSSNQRLGKRG